MIVADTNLVAYLMLEGEHTEDARRVFRNDGEWAAPLLWISEFRNVLAMYMKKEIVNASTAREIMGKAEELMAGNEYSVPSDAVLERSAASGCAAYDCEFVVLADTLNVPLVTGDRKLCASFPEATVFLSDFVSS